MADKGFTAQHFVRYRNIMIPSNYSILQNSLLSPVPGSLNAFSEDYSRWLSRLERLEFAFQPIIGALNGITYGVEALLRGADKLGYASPHELFDEAFEDGLLFLADIRLREKAIAGFKKIPFHDKLVLFYNYDPRILDMPDYRPGITERLMANFELQSDQICLEINEKYRIDSHANLRQFAQNMKERGIKVALDDFGSGFAGFETLYHTDPGILKVDRFLISGIDSDARKHSFCTHLISLCKIHGITTVAEGVETEAEFRLCRAMGFDLIQGFYVAKPALAICEIASAYSLVPDDRRHRSLRGAQDQALLARNISALEAISVSDDVRNLLDRFHNELKRNFFPVIDRNGYPLGIIHERTIKQYVYSPYGRELLANKSVTKGLRNFITPHPITDISTPQEKILEIFVRNPDCEGVIIVRNMKYAGFLTAQSLLGLINEKNLAQARDTNPLTGLPGNNAVHEFIRSALMQNDTFDYCVYFDFDHFKPFNDRYGFRQGDRALAVFAEIIAQAELPGLFIGHIGGDDFFAGLKTTSRQADRVLEFVSDVQARFTEEIRPFFTPEERDQGIYLSTDRRNQRRDFPLLSVSAAIIELVPGKKPRGEDEISLLLARLKKEAKINSAHIATESYGQAD